MATFEIHQDSEKENPQIGVGMVAKAANGIGAAAVAAKTFLPNAAIGAVVGGGGVVGGGAIALKDKLGRANFAVLNTNAGNAQPSMRAVGKTTLYEAGKQIDENAGFAVGAAQAKKTLTVAAATSTTTTTVVEQAFQAFSVYEDHNSQPPQQQKQKILLNQHSSEIVTKAVAGAAAGADIAIDKENVFAEEHFMRSESSIHKEFGFHINNEQLNLDTTPMSVSEVLSPMSVDRSQFNESSVQLNDDSDFKKVAEGIKEEHDEELVSKRLPRNDRDRFFEVVQYQQDILEYFRESEKNHRPKAQYMRRQNDINHSMRTILVDWLVEVSEEYNLDTETLYLSVSYIDRFLSHMSVVRSKLQLVGTAAMYIASKYEEIYPPDVGEFVFITDDTYTKAQVLRMEQIILKILAFDLCTPTPLVFINTYATVCGMSEQLKFLSQYIAELSLLEADPYLRFLPSQISSGAVALARYHLEMPLWDEELYYATSYDITELKEVFLCLAETHHNASNLPQQAIQEKYKADKYKQVALVPATKMTEASFDYLAGMSKKSLERKSEQSAKDNGNKNLRRMINLMFKDKN